MGELVEEIEHLVLDPLTVFFEDAEHLADDSDAAAIVGARCQREPCAAGGRASRRPLPLRVAKLRAAGRLTVVGPADLAFSASECGELLGLGGRREVSDDEVQAIMEVTEGWPLGLALGVSLAARRDGGRLVTAPSVAGELSQFLSEEVLDDLDPDFHRELVKSSLAPELTPGLAAALRLSPDFIELAAERHLLLRHLPGEGDRFAYHPLFREFLLGRMTDELDEGELGELHAGLAAALAEERPLEAAEHWLAAGREPEAVRIVGRHSQPLVRSSPDVVRDWIERISPSGRDEPAIQLIEGQLAMREGRPDDAAGFLRAAAGTWDRRGSRAAWTARFALAQTYIVLGRVDEVRLLAEGLDAPEAADVAAAPMVAIMAALATGAGGRRAEGEALVERALAHPLGRLVKPYIPAFKAYFVDWHAGRLDAALEGAQRAIAPLEEFDPMRWLPYMCWYTAYVQEARGDDVATVALLERSREVSRRYGLGDYPAAAATALKAGCDARAGRLADAELELARAASHLGTTWFSYDVELTRAELAARAGDDPAALASAERAYSLVQHGYLGERWRATRILAPLLANLGAGARASEVLDSALAARPAGTAAPRLLALRAWLEIWTARTARSRSFAVRGSRPGTRCATWCAASGRGSSRWSGMRSRGARSTPARRSRRSVTRSRPATRCSSCSITRVPRFAARRRLSLPRQGTQTPRRDFRG